LLHVVPSYLPARRYGGPIESVHGLCRALAARGHEVEVATTNVDGPGDSDVPLDKPVPLDGVQVHYFASRVLRRLYYSPRLRRFLAARVAAVDVVHTHSVFLWPTTVAAQLARARHKPYVLSPRGMLVRDLIDRRSRTLKRLWIAAFEGRNVAGAAAVHVTSPLEREAILDLGLRARRFLEVPNGVDLDFGDIPGAAPDGLPATYGLFLGRISWKKGLDRLVPALAHVPGLHFVVAGNDDEGYWPRIAALADSLGIAERIHRLGFVQGEHKRRLIGNATMLVLPSYSENFGNVVLEALAASVPVVVTPEVGLSSLVEKAGAGIVTQGEPRALAAAIAQLASDPRRTRMAENGRRAAQEYSWSAIAERMERGYQELAFARGSA
jgi:glycosyltransferase involved in cell wall biosynthesis